MLCLTEQLFLPCKVGRVQALGLGCDDPSAGLGRPGGNKGSPGWMCELMGYWHCPGANVPKKRFSWPLLLFKVLTQCQGLELGQPLDE